MKSLNIIVLLLVLMIESINAYEDREEPTIEEGRATVLEKFDTNKDDKISEEEAFGGLKDNFEEHDLDNNGYIESEELDTLPQQPLDDREGEEEDRGEDFTKNILERHDKNGDNKISLEEARGGMKRNFKRHDLNGDGYIEGEELDTLPRHIRGKHDRHFNDRR